MAGGKMQMVLALFLFIMLVNLPPIHGWGTDGHSIICKIAQSRLSGAAVDAVKELLPKWAEDDLGNSCSWADQVKFRYPWSSPLHFIDTPESCSYQYTRDCKDEDGAAGRCVAGAINNYTSQLLTYNSASNESQYNLTESLLFLSHFMGDIHQPLHVGFASDKGGNTIYVHWYTRKAVLHHVWDTNIIETAEERFFNTSLDSMVDAIQQNITSEWADQVKRWETCNFNKTACPDIYASEGIKAACDWAYKGVHQESVLEDDYFLSRLPVVNRRLAQGGVRLAATLNRIFG
ncbi:Endonuclease 2 [Hibiscus syriacus]|uniref:Aspergillus nuclease S1 n=1 Tax=Hibiscus syriacus TaxID=106335 RepID=A0A6A3BVY7_HIBSY|nr:endonuclease 2-like [Hibiscus syriacus]KAE8720735.1 Endonuclease 2 [Hibiscus syriacus]